MSHPINRILKNSHVGAREGSMQYKFSFGGGGWRASWLDPKKFLEAAAAVLLGWL